MLEIYWGGISPHRSKWGLGNTVLKTVATPEQIEKWKKHTIAIAITEPGAGSDPANIRTTATFDRETGEWMLNGEKIFISQAQSADAAMMLSRFIAPDGSRGMTTFLVEKRTPGFTVGPQLKKLGIRSHHTCNLLFENCRIPEFNHIKGDFKSTMSVFNDSRPMVGAMALGVARAALDFTCEKLAERESKSAIAAACEAARRSSIGSSGWKPFTKPLCGRCCAPSGSNSRPCRRKWKHRLRKRLEARRAKDYPGMHRFARPRGGVGRPSAGSMLQRRAHLRHLRGRRRNPAPDYRAVDTRLHRARFEVAPRALKTRSGMLSRRPERPSPLTKPCRGFQGAWARARTAGRRASTFVRHVCRAMYLKRRGLGGEERRI